MSTRHLLVVITMLISTLLPSSRVDAAPVMTHGIASGDLTSDSAIIWSCSDRDALMRVRYRPISSTVSSLEVSTDNSPAQDYTAQIKLNGLNPNTDYRYEVWFEEDSGSSAKLAGRFKTAPRSGQKSAVTLIWSGDLGGQGYCRRQGSGYTIFKPMTEFGADFYVANGDKLLFHEFLSGPLSAVRAPAPPAFDDTLYPVIFYAEGDIFNYGTLQIMAGETPGLVTDIRDETGRIRPGSELKLQPQ